MSEREPQTRSISRETSFASDTDDHRLVDGMLSYLAQRAAQTLRAEGLVARSVGVRLRYSDFETVEIRRRLPEPTDRDRPILEQVRALWPERWTRRLPLRLVGVVLHDVVAPPERQLQFTYGARLESTEFRVAEDVTPHASAPIDHAIDRIRDRHGFGSIVRGGAIDLLDASPLGANRPRARAPSRFPRHASGPTAWSKHGLRLRTPASSR